MKNDPDQISKGDIVEHLTTGQTFKVTAIVDGKLRVKGNGLSITLLMNEVTKAPDRPVREPSQIAAK